LNNAEVSPEAAQMNLGICCALQPPAVYRASYNGRLTDAICSSQNRFVQYRTY